MEQVQDLRKQEEKNKQDAMLRLRLLSPLAIKRDKAVLEIQVSGGNSNGRRSCKTEEVASLKLGKSEKLRNSSSGLGHLIFRHYRV